MSAILAAICAAGCHGHPTRPHPGTAPSFALELAPLAAPSQLRGVAGDGTRLFAARSDSKVTEVEARRATAIDWHVALPGSAGPITRTTDALVVTLSAQGTSALPPGSPLVLRGEPGAVLVALDANTGAATWRLAFDATEWAVITAIAPDGGGVIIGGTFSGTLRSATTVVSSAGQSDGFVAKIGARGELAWLIRVGGPGADAIQGVAARADRIAIAGTFTAGAELRGLALEPFDERSPFGDAFVAELDPTGARVWAQSFGGRRDDTVAGVAIDARGRVAIAATVRDVVKVGTSEVTVKGPSDGLVVWYSPTGELGAVVLLGGNDFDGLRAIAPADDHVVVGGFFSGAAAVGKHALGGHDDAFLATIASDGSVDSVWQVGGPGREEIVALAPLPGGFVAAVAHSDALTVGDDRLPGAGSALIERPY